MSIYREPEAQKLIEDLYQRILHYWPVTNRQFIVPTRQGDTFVIECGEKTAPAVLLLHGSLSNSASWMNHVAAWAHRCRVFAIDVIGEPGLSAPSRPPLASDAYCQWLDDVMSVLRLDRVSLVGVSLGGWLALDFATRRPQRVHRLVVISPSGVGRQKIGVLVKIVFLNSCGAWGKRKLRELILGPAPSISSAAARKFGEFISLIHKNTRRRRGKVPIFDDAAMKLLTMPVLAIVGGKDALLDSAETRRRIEELVPHARVRYINEAGHLITDQTSIVAEFLDHSIEEPVAD